MNVTLQARWARLSAALLLNCLALPAGAALEVVEQAFELRAQAVQLPDVAEGFLSVRSCPDCQPTKLHVTAATGWFLGAGSRQARSQAEVLDVFRVVASRPATLVYVYYEPATLRVTRIVVDPRDGAGVL